MVDKELIVKSKTELTKDTKKDILSLYSVPETLDRKGENTSFKQHKLWRFLHGFIKQTC